MVQGINTTNKTYGFLVLPFTPEIFKPQVDPKEATKMEGKLKSAVKDGGKQPSKFKGAISKLGKYINDNRNNDFKEARGLISKFSGIAVAQALVDDRVTCKSAVDYLFLGFAPALGVEASALGYSGINQMKDALTNGNINVGSFISGFSKTLKAGVDLKDQLLNKDNKTSGEIIEIDLTITHSENYQAETPDRRVEDGSTLSETVHNLPISLTMQCALQDGRRYSVEDFRSIMEEIRKRKQLLSLYLGNTRFDDLVLVSFNPNTDCTKSGYDFTLELKQIIIGEVQYTEVELQDIPKQASGSTTTIGSDGTSIKSMSTQMPEMNPAKDVADMADKVGSKFNWKASVIKQVKESFKK